MHHRRLQMIKLKSTPHNLYPRSLFLHKCLGRPEQHLQVKMPKRYWKQPRTYSMFIPAREPNHGKLGPKLSVLIPALVFGVAKHVDSIPNTQHKDGRIFGRPISVRSISRNLPKKARRLKSLQLQLVTRTPKKPLSAQPLSVTLNLLKC